MGIMASQPARACPGTGCSVMLDVSKFDASDLVLCEACDGRVEKAVAELGMHWYTSHIDPTYISWSSHPEIMARSRPPSSSCEPALKCVADGANKAAVLLRQAQAVLVVAGAGMSCDSGLPDFRGSKGFYKMGGKEISMEDVDFHDPKLRPRAWGYITKMREAFLTAAPHQGYGALRRMLQGTDFFVCTSNIDGYFARARFCALRLYECHGSLDWLQCSAVGTAEPCCKSGVWRWGAAGSAALALRAATVHEDDEDEMDASDRERCRRLSHDLPAVDVNSLTVDMEDDRLPRCCCGRLARPNVSHITDTDAQIHRERKGAQEQQMVKWLRRHLDRGTRLLIIEVGAGTSVHSMREESELLLARSTHTSIVRIDPGGATVPRGRGVGIEAGALEALVAIEASHVAAAAATKTAAEPLRKRPRQDR